MALIGLVTLTFPPLNGVTGFLPANFQLPNVSNSYAFPFSTSGQAWDRQTTAINA